MYSAEFANSSRFFMGMYGIVTVKWAARLAVYVAIVMTVKRDQHMAKALDDIHVRSRGVPVE